MKNKIITLFTITIFLTHLSSFSSTASSSHTESYSFKESLFKLIKEKSVGKIIMILNRVGKFWQVNKDSNTPPHSLAEQDNRSDIEHTNPLFFTLEKHRLHIFSN